MHAEVKSAGTKGAYAVDLVIGQQRFRIRYFEAHRVDPLKDAREFSAKLGQAIAIEDSGEKE